MNFDAARQLLEMTDEDLSQKVDPTHHYVKSYPLFLKSTAHLCGAMGSNAVPGVAHIVYGWMPTILKKLYLRRSHKRSLDCRKTNKRFPICV